MGPNPGGDVLDQWKEDVDRHTRHSTRQRHHQGGAGLVAHVGDRHPTPASAALAENASPTGDMRLIPATHGTPADGV
ncbi:hypothetical protein AB0K93_33380 [Streptomyces sp. NPDC052676]|uniref:hypothetical protein n=1 Tax=Streptomyces sp. NPDC052676 TaxID=3154953 RepID=UPI003412363D